MTTAVAVVDCGRGETRPIGPNGRRCATFAIGSHELHEQFVNSRSGRSGATCRLEIGTFRYGQNWG